MYTNAYNYVTAYVNVLMCTYVYAQVFAWVRLYQTTYLLICLLNKLLRIYSDSENEAETVIERGETDRKKHAQKRKKTKRKNIFFKSVYK